MPRSRPPARLRHDAELARSTPHPLPVHQARRPTARAHTGRSLRANGPDRVTGFVSMPESAKVPGGRSPVRFSRIEQPRTHVYLAEQLRREITLGVLPTGGTLPPERELAAMVGVARATVQQAVRMLESEGLVTARRGRGGGTFVTGPASDSVSRHRLNAHVSRNRRPIEEAVTYRLEIEPAAAGEAARARTADDLAGLGQ